MPTTQASLLGLPPEIRLGIYQYLFPDIATPECREVEYKFPYPNDRRRDYISKYLVQLINLSRYSGISMCCRQIFSEAHHYGNRAEEMKLIYARLCLVPRELQQAVTTGREYPTVERLLRHIQDLWQRPHALKATLEIGPLGHGSCLRQLLRTLINITASFPLQGLVSRLGERSRSRFDPQFLTQMSQTLNAQFGFEWETDSILTIYRRS